MERLQSAIEKARAQREGRGVKKRSSDRAEAMSATVQAIWDALPQIEFKNRLLHRNRIVTVRGGRDSAPYDLLRTRIIQQAKANDWRRIAFVSSHSGCGKSTTLANLAFSLARQQGLRSMIFDFDLRRSGLTKLFGQTCAYGMADVLEGRVTFADQGRRYENNVAFGFDRGAVNRPSEILQSAQTRDVLDELQAIYKPDLMLFDMPPLNASDDNFGFLANVDCGLLMVAAEKTSMAQIDVAERQVAELTNVMGIVLNKCRYTEGAYGHEYGYY